MSAPDGGDPFSVQERDEAGVRVLAVAGELDIATAPELCARLDASRSFRRPRLLVDLTDVDFCDSTGLRALLGAASEVRAHGGRFAIVCPTSGRSPACSTSSGPASGWRSTTTPRAVSRR